jgi:hypothetical protein
VCDIGILNLLISEVIAMKSIRLDTRQVREILDGRMTEVRIPIKFAVRNNAGGFLDSRYNEIKPPYQPGDILYVREKFNNTETDSILYAADKDFIDFGCKEVDKTLLMESEIKWSPSTHMPKEAARIFLKVTEVRIERVQDITAQGIRDEGLTSMCVHVGDMEIAKQEFAILWDSIYKSRGYGWDANPWIWVIKFVRLEGRPCE